ncbi:MAG: glycine--tRNA ligase subunit beta, partial [Alphaproteobacteria bacterium]|nr:glycine--tRNA ligase subunit beta [Alphaproteobacteria bacterium]
RMQAKAEADLKKAVVDGLVAAGLGADGRADGNWAVTSMSGPRRLAVCVDGLAARSVDVEEERKGPKVGAPEQAVAGFLRGAGLSDISEVEVRSDPKKGDFYVAVRKIEGRETSAIVAELVPEIVRGFHWPKSMRTGTGELRWVRPLQRILCVFDGQVVDFEIDGVASGDLTEGHRVHGRGPFKVSDLDSYVSALGGDGHVMLTRDARRTKIEADAEAVCAAAGLQLVEDKGLLEEVVGLAEWPQVVLGDMDPAFLELPPEVIQLSMRTHQKYFAVRDKTGQLAPHFVVVANIDASDGGQQIAAGNRKVLSARLDDGRFFWDNDKKTGLEAMAPKLSTIKFKDELGSIGDKVERVAALARELAPTVGANPDLAERAARLCKADLVSEMVYEFPELQGVMGRYYALEAGEDAKVADAIRDHYKPQGPSDAVPTDPVGIAVALADKLDTLVGFWAIDEKPTGSKDPFALRRAALGVVRIVLENEVRLPLYSVSLSHLDATGMQVIASGPVGF